MRRKAPSFQGEDISRPPARLLTPSIRNSVWYTWINVKRQQGYVFRLTPTAAQDSLLRQFVGCSRLVWNAVLSKNASRYAAEDPLPIGRKSFCTRVLHLKAR